MGCAVNADWKAKTAASMADVTRVASAQLRGRTIERVEMRNHYGGTCDCENVLILFFTDGTACQIEGGYTGYTGHSCDEYQQAVEPSLILDLDHLKGTEVAS